MSQRLIVAQRAARAAGQVLIKKLAEGRTIKSKGRRDIVTDADFAADKIIRQTLLSRFSKDKMLSEEGTAEERAVLWKQAEASDDLNLWVVDPLDGTTNYSRAIYPFTVSIGLYRAGTVQVGVVYDPIRKELFSAERGRGAFLNGKPICVSDRLTLEDAVISTEWARAPKVRRKTSAVFGKIIDQVMSGRAYGSAALTMCSVAAGRLDGYIHLALSPWDVAAACLIIDEAGGKTTNSSGKAWTVHSGEYICSNGHLHSKILRYCR